MLLFNLFAICLSWGWDTGRTKLRLKAHMCHCIVICSGVHVCTVICLVGGGETNQQFMTTCAIQPLCTQKYVEGMFETHNVNKSSFSVSYTAAAGRESERENVVPCGVETHSPITQEKEKLSVACCLLFFPFRLRKHNAREQIFSFSDIVLCSFVSQRKEKKLDFRKAVWWESSSGYDGVSPLWLLFVSDLAFIVIWPTLKRSMNGALWSEKSFANI